MVTVGLSARPAASSPGTTLTETGIVASSLFIDSMSTQRSSSSQTLARPSSAERRDVDLEQDPARLARVEVAELDHEAALGRGRRKVVEEAHRGDLVARAHGEARGLDRLGSSRPSTSEASAAPASSPCSAKLRVAAAAARDRGQQVLVVAEADADRRGGDPASLGAGGEALELLVVGDALVGVAVGEQDQGRPAAVGGALGLLDSAQQAAGEIGHAARVDGGQRLAGAGAVADVRRPRPGP